MNCPFWLMLKCSEMTPKYIICTLVPLVARRQLAFDWKGMPKGRSMRIYPASAVAVKWEPLAFSSSTSRWHHAVIVPLTNFHWKEFRRVFFTNVFRESAVKQCFSVGRRKGAHFTACSWTHSCSFQPHFSSTGTEPHPHPHPATSWAQIWIFKKICGGVDAWLYSRVNCRLQ